jgi:acyl-CoA thioesterase FadM
VKREVPFDIPAGATESIDCTLEPSNSGSFEFQLHVFLDDNGTRTMTITVRGVAVERSTGDDKPPP